MAVVVISKPAAVAPNTKISVAGVSLTLKEQIASPGVLTVNGPGVLHQRHPQLPMTP